jgi:hypothetical protein
MQVMRGRISKQGELNIVIPSQSRYNNLLVNPFQVSFLGIMLYIIEVGVAILKYFKFKPLYCLKFIVNLIESIYDYIYLKMLLLEFS